MKSKRGMLANIIGAFVVIIIGVSLIPTITEQVKTATAEAGANLTSTDSQWAATILDLIPGLFALCILGIGVAVAYSALRPIFEGESFAGKGPGEDTRTDEEKMLDKLKDTDDDFEEKDEEEEFEEDKIKNKQKYIKMEAVIDSIPEPVLNDKSLKEKSNSFDKTKYD